MKKKKAQEIHSALDKTKFTIDELTIDLSAFLQFLFNQAGNRSGEASYWSLIPDSLDVKWDDDVEDFYLKKNLHERRVYIYAKPVADSFRERRKADLLVYFHSIIAEEQINAVTLLMSKLKVEDRERLKDDFLKYKKSVEANASSDKQKTE